MSKETKSFFFKIVAADLMNFATDPDGECMSLLQFAKHLQRGESDIPFIQGLIDESYEYRRILAERNSLKGKLSAEKRLQNKIVPFNRGSTTVNRG